MFNIDVRGLAKSFKEPLAKSLEEKFDLSKSEAEEYADRLIEGSINRTENALHKTLIELSERSK